MESNLVEVVLKVGQRGGDVADHEAEALEGAVAGLRGGQQPLGGDAEHVADHAQHVVAELVADALLHNYNTLRMKFHHISSHSLIFLMRMPRWFILVLSTVKSVKQSCHG